MDDLSTIFVKPDVDEWRRERLRRIQRTLRRGAAEAVDEVGRDTDLEFAVAHHLLEGAESAARANNAERFAWYTSRVGSSFAELSLLAGDSRHIVLAPDLSNMAQSEISESPYYLVEPESVPVDAALRGLVEEALLLATEAGFGSLVATHASVICLLRPRRLGATLASWTITRLPGTVYTDHVGDPAVLARDLVHEAGHNWLNAILSARGIAIPDAPKFFSPWKRELRPPFGFIHACWAFPLTMLYSAWALDSTSGAVAAFLSAYSEQQRALLAGTAALHSEALGLIDDADVRGALAAVYGMARSL